MLKSESSRVPDIKPGILENPPAFRSFNDPGEYRLFGECKAAGLGAAGIRGVTGQVVRRGGHNGIKDKR